MSFITLPLITCAMVLNSSGFKEEQCADKSVYFVQKHNIVKISTNHSRVCDILCSEKDTCDVTFDDGRKELVNRPCDEIDKEMRK